MSAGAPTTLLVLSEDSGGEGRTTIKAVLERVINSWSEGRKVLEIDVTSTSPSAAYANLWSSKTRTHAFERIEFLKQLATDLAKSGRFVVFHYDGDTTWKLREQAPRRAQFEKLRVQLSQLSPKVRQERLLEMVPHYSIESWVYQASDVAIELCHKHHQGRDAEKFDAWRGDRALLDEVHQPKDATVLAAKHNEALAKAVPAADVVAVDKSLAAFARQLGALPEFAPLLRPGVTESLANGSSSP